VLSAIAKIEENLVKKRWDEFSFEMVFLGCSQDALVFERNQSVSLEKRHKFFRHHSGCNLSFSPHSLVLSSSLLEIPALGLLNSSASCCFYTLGFHQLRLFKLEESTFMCIYFFLLKVLDHFDLPKLQCLSDEDLENWLHF
jgi:hypothetical protein